MDQKKNRILSKLWTTYLVICSYTWCSKTNFWYEYNRILNSKDEILRSYVVNSLFGYYCRKNDRDNGNYTYKY